MKRLISLLLSSFIILSGMTYTLASETAINMEEPTEDLHVEYMIEETNITKTRSTYKKVGTKTTKIMSGSSVLWTVKVTGTFEYDGSHSTCTAASVSTTVSNSYWKIASKSATKRGSSATAKATGQRYNNGVVVETYTEAVTLVCGSDGTLY